MVKLLSIERTPNQNKAFVATFELQNKKKKIVRFGTSSNFLTNPDKTASDKKNYIARHSVRERFDRPMTAGALSRWILWTSRDLEKNIREYKNRFNV